MLPRLLGPSGGKRLLISILRYFNHNGSFEEENYFYLDEEFCGDLLSQLEEAVVESLGAGKEMIAKAVADSWRPQVCSKLARLICFCSIMSFSG